MKTNKKKNLPMCGMISLPAGISKRMSGRKEKGKKLFSLEKSKEEITGDTIE